MKKYFIYGIIFLLLGLVGFAFGYFAKSITPDNSNNDNNSNFSIEDKTMISLPKPNKDGSVSLEEALSLRRSVRQYSETPLTLEDISQLLWSAQGVTDERGFRTAPSAGATFPLEMYFVVNHSEDLDKGIYHYYPDSHSIYLVREGDFGSDVQSACMGQSSVGDASVIFIFGAVFERTMDRYGERGKRYVYNEIGHASQNLHLQAAALDLGTVVIGAYSDEEIEKILNLGQDVNVLYVMPVGKISL